MPDMISSLQPFTTASGKEKMTEQGYIRGVRDYRGMIIKLEHIPPKEEIVSIDNSNYGLSGNEKERIKLDACLNTLKTFEQRGLNLEKVSFIWEKEEYNAKEFLENQVLIATDTVSSDEEDCAYI